ncbi:uncharacterized protein [Gorilla gorilla gorilla]|uniref:uncharacterized protein n=1 Tax=Gorilla gorilla gorilla TaxID=9595 RepID=UPI002445669D|nr:uncharacterized protein LOC129530306 [Gorilla gorilla gorilla]XP_055233122.1 uncharacterized protein LOC129530306 [Gorilla gorilla gorilla]
MSVTDQAFVTLATDDIYCQGALVLGQSLRRHRLTRKLVVLITPQVSVQPAQVRLRDAACAQLGPIEGGSPLPQEVLGVILMTDHPSSLAWMAGNHDGHLTFVMNLRIM